MSFGFDPIAFLTSLFAVWFAWNESRKNNTVLLKILRCECSGRQAIDENRGQGFTEFRVLIRNQGIALYDPQLAIGFREGDGFGSVTVPLKRRADRTGQISQFARGMVAEFGFKTYEMDGWDKQALRNLKDVAGQETRLTFFSQGYVAKVFRVGRFKDRLARRWNGFAHRINWRFNRKIGEHGMKLGRVLPANALDLSFPLQFFIQHMDEEAAAGQDQKGSKSPISREG